MDQLRKVRLQGRKGNYTLTTWDTFKTDRWGKSILRYKFTGPDGKVIFSGEDFAVPAVHSIDSDEVLRSLLTFLTLRPGDTDDEYFEKYSARQLKFAEEDAEELSGYAMEEDGYPFEDVGAPGGKRRGKGRRGGKRRARGAGLIAAAAALKDVWR